MIGERESYIWRRHKAPSAPKIARIVRAVPLKGVGRVPLPVGNCVVVPTFIRSAKAYAYRLFNEFGEQKWLQVLPAGGYASPVYVPERHGLWVPFAYSRVAELNVQDGSVRWTVDFGVRVRSAPLFDKDSGTYVSAIGNAFVRYDAGRVLQQRQVPGHFFFGVPSQLEGMLLTLTARRANDRLRNAVTAVDLKTLTIVWETDIGENCVVSSDTCGLGIDPDGRYVFAHAPPGRVICLDAENGKELWCVELGLTNWRVAPEVTRDCVYVSSLEGDLVALSIDGQLKWRICLDPLGIWSPPLANVDECVVHGGTWLWGVSAADGSVRWAVPIGFDAYTRPVRCNGFVIVCGGDPPDDGYLFWIDTGASVLTRWQRAEYAFGQEKDYLIVECEFDEEIQEVRLDLAPFGRSSDECCRREGSVFRWEGTVDIQKRWAESVIVGKVYKRAEPVDWFTIWVDTGSARSSSAAAEQVINDFEVHPQPDVTSSGGEVVAALLSRWGKLVDPNDVVSAARWMRGKGVDPHYLWRGGAARIFMASQLPLLEVVNEQLTPKAIEDLISRWERQVG